MAGLAATSSVVGAPAPASMDTVVPAGAGRVSDRVSEEFDGTIHLRGWSQFGSLLEPLAPDQPADSLDYSCLFPRMRDHCPAAAGLMSGEEA